MNTYHLIITEKPSVARQIAAVLNAKERRDGFFIGNNRSPADSYIVSWCAGHLLELAAPDSYDERYSKWRYADLPIVPAVWKHNPVKEKTAQLKILKELINRADVETVINACDAGREGEHIFRLVYEHAKGKKPIKRLWISSMEDSAIQAGFNNLKDGAEYDRLCAAATCRERADWLMGLNATRLFSVLYGATLNTGRVQSPTLSMLVRREADITTFVKEPFFTPVIDCAGFTAFGERTKDKNEAEIICGDCNDKTAVVRSVERQKKTAAPPKLYDLTTLQREANRLFGFTAQQTLDYAQTLYEKRLLTYPRTDSRYLTGDMRETASDLLVWLQFNLPYSGSKDFVPDFDRMIDDSKVTDHHAIIPTTEIFKADLSALPSGERDILNLAAVRLLCAAASVHSFETAAAVFDCENHSFTAKGKTVLEDGWKEIDTAFKMSLKTAPEAEDHEDDASLPELSKGQTFESVTASVKEGATAPPKHYTEDTLLLAMENAGAAETDDDVERKGLGTPATRAATVEKIIKAGLVERKKKNLIPTDKGKNLITILPDALTSPLLTAQWENKLKQVERGELPDSEFMDGITAYIKTIVAENDTPKPEYEGLFSEKKNDTPSLGSCPRCKSSVREYVKGFFCDSHSCGFKLWKDSKFWTAKKKSLTADIVTALLKDGRVDLKGLYSEKSGKKYDAAVILDDKSDGYVNFKMEFKNGRLTI
ncbi:DNA topoisomerase 3 [Eubacteriales bacterium OttesenSCG-928-G02]|nr:DNA topoisomerase 3 [Eubacteriales bacterium OttesenSCG-928-G02]